MNPFTIVCLGDSTTAGTPGFFSPRERPPEGQGDHRSQYAYWMQKEHPQWKVLNRGVRGQRTDQMLRRFDWDVLPLHPDILIVIGGVNDLYQGRDIASIQSNLLKIYEKAAAGNMKVMTGTILPLNLLEEENKKRILEMNLWIRETAREKKLGFCDTYTAMEDPARPGFLVSSPDEIHPDAEGYRVMGLSLRRSLAEQMTAKV